LLGQLEDLILVARDERRACREEGGRKGGRVGEIELLVD